MNHSFNKHQHERRNIFKLASVLFRIDPDVDFEDWVRALRAVDLETGGSDEGLALADAWASTGHHYPGPDTVASTWESFRCDRENPDGLGALLQLAKKKKRGA
jgi:Primase C terminal 2 (PriCT-2)